MKKVRELLLVSVIAFVLCGCYKANININVLADGTAEMSMEVLMQEEMLDSMNMSVEDLKKNIMESMDEEVKNSSTVKNITRTYDNDKYVGLEIAYDMKKNDAQNFANTITVKEDRITFLMDENAVGNVGSNDLGEIDTSQMKGVEFNLNITMPGKILEHNCGEVDGNTVKIDLLTFQESKIEIISNISSNDNTLYIVGGIAIAAIIIVAAFIVWKKKKGKSDTQPTETAQENSNVEFTADTTNEELKTKTEENN